MSDRFPQSSRCREPGARRWREPRASRKAWVVVGAVVCLVAFRIVQTTIGWSAPRELAEGEHRVSAVIDGDTIELVGKARVRLIGVDSPESTEPLGPEASEFTRRFTEGGTVRIEVDRERVDRFGRFLAYVWVGDRMLNEELVRAGLARYEPKYQYSAAMKRRYKLAQEDARARGVGLWAKGN
jgi:micrococcal nuclease